MQIPFQIFQSVKIPFLMEIRPIIKEEIFMHLVHRLIPSHCREVYYRILCLKVVYIWKILGLMEIRYRLKVVELVN